MVFSSGCDVYRVWSIVQYFPIYRRKEAAHNQHQRIERMSLCTISISTKKIRKGAVLSKELVNGLYLYILRVHIIAKIQDRYGDRSNRCR